MVMALVLKTSERKLSQVRILYTPQELDKCCIYSIIGCMLSTYTGVSDHRTQVYFPNELYEAIKKKAQKRGVSMARVVREAVEEKIEVKKKVVGKRNDLLKYAGMIKGGPSDVSGNMRKYLKEMYKF